MSLLASRTTSVLLPLGLSFAAVLVSFAFTATNASAQVRADDRTNATHARLGLLSTRERELLEPHLVDGPVALVEFADGGALPAVIYAAIVRAPARTIVDTIADLPEYPRFMPALDTVEVLGHHNGTTAYDWTWQTGVFTLSGSNVMTVYPGPEHRRDRPWRVESRATGGDLGHGRLMWRVYPRGPRESLVVLSTRLDLREANFLTRQMGRGRRSINRTVNLGLATVMVLGTQREAERRAGVAPIEAPERELTRPDVNFAELAPLMNRGDILFMGMTGGRLDQVAVVGRPGTNMERVRQVMSDPREFGPALIPGAYVDVLSEESSHIDFEWGINIPLVGTSGTMRLSRNENDVAIHATEGGLAGGQWHFHLEALPWGEPVVLGWADFDPATAGWLIAAVVEGNSEFGYGLTAGAEVMVMRAIRSRAHRRYEARVAAGEDLSE